MLNKHMSLSCIKKTEYDYFGNNTWVQEKKNSFEIIFFKKSDKSRNYKLSNRYFYVIFIFIFLLLVFLLIFGFLKNQNNLKEKILLEIREIRFLLSIIFNFFMGIIVSIIVYKSFENQVIRDKAIKQIKKRLNTFIKLSPNYYTRLIVGILLIVSIIPFLILSFIVESELLFLYISLSFVNIVFLVVTLINLNSVSIVRKSDNLPENLKKKSS